MSCFSLLRHLFYISTYSIIFCAALYFPIPVLLHDRNSPRLQDGLALRGHKAVRCLQKDSRIFGTSVLPGFQCPKIASISLAIDFIIQGNKVGITFLNIIQDLLFETTAEI